MTEYIEREAVLKIVADNCPHDKGGYNTEEEMGAGAACCFIRKAVETVPAADVVPKVEFEAMRGAANSYKMHYENAKAEVAREFAEKVKEIKIKCAFPLFGLATKTEIEIFVNDIFIQMRDGIDNLVKEFTEGADNGDKQ